MSIQSENIPNQENGERDLEAFKSPALDNLYDAFELTVKIRRLMERGLASEALWLNAMAAYYDEVTKAHELGLINIKRNR